MSNSKPAVEAAQQLLDISHLPASMNGSPFLYTTTLTAMMCGALLGLYVVCWMVKDMYRDRASAGRKSVLFNFRLMMATVGLTGFVACVPEVLYLQMYNDPQVSSTVQGAVTMGKRFADSSRIYLIMGWVGLLTMIYPYVCLALMEFDVHENQNVIKYLQVEDYPGLDRLAKPAFIFAVIALIAMAFAFSKVYGI